MKLNTLNSKPNNFYCRLYIRDKRDLINERREVVRIYR